MFPGYEYVLAFAFLICTAVASVATTQNTMLSPSYNTPTFLSK